MTEICALHRPLTGFVHALNGDTSGLYGVVRSGVSGNATGIFGDISRVWSGSLDWLARGTRLPDHDCIISGEDGMLLPWIPGADLRI